MKKYEKIIKQLYHIDKLGYEAFEISLRLCPSDEEYKEMCQIQDDCENEARALLVQLKACAEWYRRRAKTPEDLELVIHIEAEHDRLYEHMVCDLPDEEIDRMAIELLKDVIGGEAVAEQEQKESQEIGNIRLGENEYSYENAIRRILEVLTGLRSEIFDLTDTGDLIELRKSADTVAGIDKNMISLLGLLKNTHSS